MCGEEEIIHQGSQDQCNPFCVGTHIKKESKLLTTFQNFYNTNDKKLPCQIFTGSTKTWNRNVMNDSDNIATKNFIQSGGINFFIHSIYLINLGRPNNIQAINCLADELELGEKIGAKGVVVHCGKYLKESQQVAKDNMYQNIINTLDHISESCPLLIETPAGQGTELLTSYEELSNFYNRFTIIEKKKIKVCIDTCHIWNSGIGYEPYDYILRWITDHPESLVLVHFNDSKMPKGSNVDRHEYPGKGFIGEEEMLKVCFICRANNIPMVIE
jgi:deoxyribonuclease-4